MKSFSLFTIIVFYLLICFLPQNAVGKCLENPDKLYNRKVVLNEMIKTLNASIPDYEPKSVGFYIYQDGSSGGFFIYDLFDPSNNDIHKNNNCIKFLDNHVYHFAPYRDSYSASHILILENGKLKFFKSINCDNSNDSLTDVLSYVEPRIKNNKNRNEIITRIKNYQKYGRYLLTDFRQFYCVPSKPKIYDNFSVSDDEIYKGKDPILELSYILNDSIPIYNSYNKIFSNGFFTDRKKAIGFFVYDLTDPRNRQTAQDETVRFVKNHVYHFAPIDLPWSFSFIAVLGEKDMKIFSTINCEGKGDSLKDVVGYLNKKLKNDKNKDEIIKRVKNYREYGVYTSFDGISTPQCKNLKL